MYRRLESIYNGFVTNCLFFSLIWGTRIGFTSTSAFFKGADYTIGDYSTILVNLSLFIFFGLFSSC